jgi:HK97 family phage portal protein
MAWLKAVAAPPATRAAKTPGTSLVNPSTWLIDLLGGPDSATGIKVTEDMALTANAVWACVKILTESIAALPLHTYRNLPGGGKEKAPDYGLYPLLHDQPNAEMTTMEWRETAIGHLALWGNAYAEIERDQAFRPIAIWPLRPDKMMVWRNDQTRELEYIYSLWQGGTVYLRPDEVLHIRTLSRDGILGLSPIGQQREAIGLGLALERYGGGLFGNGANPGGVISVPGILSEPAKEKLRESWERQHRGPGNAGRTAVLEQGVTWQATGMKPEDAQFILGRQFSLQEVARIYRMPLHKLQDLSHATFGNIEQQGLEFVTDTLLPYLVRFEQAARRSLIPERDRSTYFVEHLVDGLLRGDLASRYAAYAVGRQWGWLSPDDIRERENLNPLPDGVGAEYLRPLNMVPGGTPYVPPAVPAVPPGPDAPGTDQPPAGGSSADPGSRLLEPWLEDIGRRLTAREDADICRAARKWLGRRRPEEFRRWLGGFLLEHRAWIADQVRPAITVLDPEFAEELVEQLAARHLLELGKLLADFDSVAELEARLATWKAERPAQMAQNEARRALRGGQIGADSAQIALSGLISRLAEPPQAPQVTIENHQPVTVHPSDVRVDVAAPPPAQTTIGEGAVRVDVAPSQMTIAEGAMRVDVAPPNLTVADGALRVDVAAAPAPDVRIEDGAVRVDVTAPPVQIADGAVRVDVQAPPAPQMTIAEGAMRVDVAPAQTTIAEGAVRVDVQPAQVSLEEGAVRVDVAPPPPAEVTIAEGAVQVDVAAPPPADVTIAEGAVQVDVAPAQVTIGEGAVQVDVQPPPPADVDVQVDVAPPPPAQTTIAEGAVRVDVAPAQAPQVTFQAGSVQIPPPPKPPQPRLQAAKDQMTRRQRRELRRRRRRGKES